MRGKLNIVGIILLVAGAAVLIYGIVQFVEFRQSFAGSVAGLGRKLGGQRANQEIQSIIMMVVGGIAAAAGLYITVKR